MRQLSLYPVTLPHLVAVIIYRLIQNGGRRRPKSMGTVSLCLYAHDPQSLKWRRI